MYSSKLGGSTLIVIGTMVGAGMLALPLSSAKVGFLGAAPLLIAIWLIMTITGLYTLEVNLAFPKYNNSLSTMAASTLGVLGKILTWLCTLLILYSLTAAYISGNASLLHLLSKLIFNYATPHWLDVTLFLGVMGSIIFWSTRAVDYCNRYLFSIKGILLITTLLLLAPQVNVATLLRSTPLLEQVELWSMIPIFICSFGFHPVIPSLSNYLNLQPHHLKRAISYGATITLVLYLCWLFVVLGLIPWEGNNSFSTLLKNQGSVGELIRAIYLQAHHRLVTISLNSFSNVAMTTSFLGVALGLFDFLADGFNRPNTRSGRTQTALLTFVPPVIFALFSPNCFLVALKYAALFATLLVIIFPPLMAYKLRRHRKLTSPYRVPGGDYLIILTIALGGGLLILQIVTQVGWLW